MTSGRFFWYVPVRQASTRAMTIAVAVGDNPLGPFADALGHPLIDGTVANHSAFDIDPTVLIDDGQAYIYWGSFSSPRAAKLKDNMIELAELGDPVAGGIKNSLTAQLNQVLALYQRNKNDGAVSVVNDFIAHVNGLRSDGALTADQATFLIASAHAITAHILE